MFNCNISYASSMQCYICVYNKACKPNSIGETTEEANFQCRGCKMQRYCSLKHLVEDREHHEVCSALANLQKSLHIEHPLLLHGPIQSRTQLQQTVAQLMLATRLKLGRKLTQRERQLICYPNYCMVCYSLNSLRACFICESVAYCSAAHYHQDMVHHTHETCTTLTFYYSPHRWLESHLKIANFKLPSDLERSCLVDAFYRATRIQVNNRLWSCLEDYEKFVTCSSFSGISSICLALKTITFVAAPHETLNVYVVGATEEHRRYFQEMHLKFFFLQYELVWQLVVYFIGHQLQPQEDEFISFNMKGSERKVLKRTFAMTFENFAKSHKADPVLIMIYDPDFAALDGVVEVFVEHNYPHLPIVDNPYDWHSCLQKILYIHNVPICFTSSTKMHFRSNISYLIGVAEACEIDINNIYDCEENPYREILPHPNLNPDDSETIIYANNYLKVFYTTIK